MMWGINLGITRSLYYFSRKKGYGFIGLVIIIFSFLHWQFPLVPINTFLANVLFMYGNILFFDFLSYELEGWSPLRTKKFRIGRATQFLLLGLLGGLILEIYTHWLGRFWYYPNWNMIIYILIFVPGFSFYFFYLFETYLGTKAVIKHFMIHRHKKEEFKKYKTFYRMLGLIGVIGLSITTIYILLRISWNISFKEFLSILNTPVLSEVPFLPFFLVPLFFWLFFEWLEYERRETSMLYELMEGNPAPIIAVFISAWLSAILYEVFNTPGGLWRYANIPLPDVTLFGLPLMIYLMWPAHYLPLFSLYRILFKKDTERIWK